MMRKTVVGVVLAMMLAVIPALAQEDGAAVEALVNMTADQWTAGEVAAEIDEQTGVQVAVTEWTEGSVTGTLSDFTVEQAVSSMGQAANTSWVRFYLLESAPPAEPYTASELIVMLQEARSAWFEGLTDEQRQQLFSGMRGRRAEDGQGPQGPRDQGGPAPEGNAQQAQPAEEGRPAAEQGEQPRQRAERGQNFGNMFEGPGGAIARPPRPEPTEGAEGEGRGGGWNRGMDQYEDPLRGLLLPGRTDTITLDLTDVPLADALSEFMMKSHFVVGADDDLTGTVSVQLEDAPLSEALDAIAASADAQWRPVYIVSAPRRLTEQEIAQREATREERREQAWNERWGEFWAQPQQERTAELQERIERMERMHERIQQRVAENPERAQRWQGRMQRFGERMLTRMMDYTAQLTPEQRLELKPLLQAMAKMNAGQ